MANINVLNSRETKHILEKLEAQYGYVVDKNELDYIFLMNNENRIYVISRDLGLVDYEQLRVDANGVYFGEIYKEMIRLSIEGAQLIGEKATKNVYDLDYDQMIEWIKGNDIDYQDTGKEFVIVRYLEPKTGRYDILGCGKYNSQTGKIINYVSKSRKLVVVND
ncbi:MAG: hypothetical protein ACP5NV_05095 [Candidatus Woesearchaeota archaeon]